MARVKESIVPRVQNILDPAIEAYQLLGSSAVNDQVDDKVAELLDLNSDAREELHGDGPRTEFSYRMAWVRTWLKNAQLLENSGRAIWALTKESREMSQDDLVGIEELVKIRHAAAGFGNADIKPDQPELDLIDGPNDQGWQQQLLACLLRMEPSAFERLCRHILLKKGFTKVEVTGRSSDGGVDGQGVLRVNLLSFQVIFQSKRWKSTVGAPVVRDFRGAMVGRADKGLIITTSNFSAEARIEATRDGAPAIDLVDGDDLCELLKELSIGVKVELIEKIDIDETVFVQM